MRPEEYKISKEKFNLVNENKRLHDKELVTKPVGYFKDAMYRFSRNKGSIFGAIVIGILVLYSIIAPIFSPYTVSYKDNYYSRTLPKLFDSDSIDFIDGAKSQTDGFISFANNYAIGVETGYNAIKRQEYTIEQVDGANGEKIDRYNYRLDTYNAVGTVYMRSIAKADYLRIQDYQDRTGLQVIYPITDPDKRPVSQKNLNNANYWYETENVEGNDVPVNYTVNADGSISFPNIYKKFSSPELNASTSNKPADIYLTAKNGGYLINVKADIEYSEDGQSVIKYTDLGYISVFAEEDYSFVEFVDDVNEASIFKYNSTYDTFFVNVPGHDNSGLDGMYFFGLNATQGSSAKLIKTTEIDSGNYIMYKVCDKDNNPVDSLSENVAYNFTANRYKEIKNTYFVGSVMIVQGETTIEISNKSSTSTKFTVTQNGSGYAIGVPGKFPYYISAVASGNETKIARVNSVDNAVQWEFDASKKAIKANITGHADASLDGYYYFAVDFNNNEPFATLIKDTNVTDNSCLYHLSLTTGSIVEVDSLTVDTQYYFFAGTTSYQNAFYALDGGYKGDNYNSKMRVEGEDKYLYSYAIPKDGNNFEIRVCYREYYKYYHQEVLKDRIVDPYFLFGTTDNGQDIFTCLASGARFSFILAISVAFINFLIGTIYGAIEGYYGGKVDMIMERIVEILSAVPFMIVITLLKYHMDNTPQWLILFISFFLTGWIGMSGTVRMQFYRFKGQEYVLAARTLGAKDPRIMFKHILPNSLGTIITGSVLVIPGMIFSETSLSYLGIINLNDGNMTSVGTLLANGQPFLVTFPHMILFPSLFISLLMLCFNLFGNGLRDAFNPSLRGVEE